MSKEAALKLPPDTPEVNYSVTQRNQFKSLTNRYGFTTQRQSIQGLTPNNSKPISSKRNSTDADAKVISGQGQPHGQQQKLKALPSEVNEQRSTLQNMANTQPMDAQAA